MFSKKPVFKVQRKRTRTDVYKIENHFSDLITEIYLSNGNKKRIRNLKTKIEFYEIQGYPVERYQEIYENILTEFSH